MFLLNPVSLFYWINPAGVFYVGFMILVGAGVYSGVLVLMKGLKISRNVNMFILSLLKMDVVQAIRTAGWTRGNCKHHH